MWKFIILVCFTSRQQVLFYFSYCKAAKSGAPPPTFKKILYTVKRLSHEMFPVYCSNSSLHIVLVHLNSIQARDFRKRKCDIVWHILAALKEKKWRKTFDLNNIHWLGGWSEIEISTIYMYIFHSTASLNIHWNFSYFNICFSQCNKNVLSCVILTFSKNSASFEFK